MAKPELIARQSRRPSGWLGEIVARVMAFRDGAREPGAVEELGVRTADLDGGAGTRPGAARD